MTRLYGTFFDVCPLKRGITAQEIYDAVYAKIDDINAHIEAMAAEKVDKKSYRSFFVTLEEYNKLKQYLEEIRRNS